MSKQITLDVPDSLEQRLEPYRDRLPELLERGLRDMEIEPTAEVEDVSQIITLLASQPTAEQILAIKPSAKFQARVSELLSQNKAGTLDREGEIELERYLLLEHLVRLAKARAYEQLSLAS
jgi:hypothetical protein